MAYVIGISCEGVNDRSCTDVCPVDCIGGGDSRSYINPAACIDCGACVPACPVDAIFGAADAEGDGERQSVEDNARFFR